MVGWMLAAAAAMIGPVPAIAAAPDPAPTEVLVLGTYHFGAPGRDLHNLRPDDVLSERRQADLELLNAGLAQFRPTKIMIEAEAADLIDPGYAAFRPDQLRTKTNEIVQIGYRLARHLGHSRVYAIDEQPKDGEPDYFPFGKVMEFAKAHDQAADLDRNMARAGAATKENEALQATASIPALLMRYNDPASFLASNDAYYDMLRIGDAVTQPGAELNAYWYMRNAKIFAKLIKAAAPGDRVLVIFGAGHGHWLRHFARETPGFRNVDVLPYLQRASRRDRP